MHQLTAIITALGLFVAGFSTPALAGYDGKGNLEKCLKAVSKVKPGSFVKVEYLIMTDEGHPAYEVEVRDSNGNEWEFECRAKDAVIVEVEREVDSVDDPLFKKRMKVSEADARTTATALYPGEVEEVEYELQANGEPAYEFDIRDEDGTEWKIEVSAESGEIIEVQIEGWEIGEEDLAG